MTVLRFVLESVPAAAAGVTVDVRPLLDGENVSQYSAGIVTEPGGDPIVGYLQPALEGDRLTGRFEPGSYEAYIIFQREGKSVWSEDAVVLHAEAR